MLFSSFQFILIFLPITFTIFFTLGHLGWKRAATLSLVLASVIFYGYWNPKHVPLLLASIHGNYYLGRLLAPRSGRSDAARRSTLILGITLNLLALGYFKYTGFVFQSINDAFGAHLAIPSITLPLAISFFTFTQIAYLVDSCGGDTASYGLLDYMLFVTTFPHLIAGPIVHHRSLVPQFRKDDFFQIQPKNVAIGLSVFVLGLAKKVLLADRLAGFADPVFAHAAQGHVPLLLEALIADLAFILQLYFDFSGYSDMAIGLGLLFNIRLPVNFASPYQAVNVSDLWRRWHVTLSQFLRDYVYTPLALAGARREIRGAVYINLMITMVLAGLWHGAGWNYLLFGVIMGIFLNVHYLWQRFTKRRGWKTSAHPLLKQISGRALTFLCVMIAWAVFRANGARAAWTFLSAFLHPHLRESFGYIRPEFQFGVGQALQWIVPGLIVVWFLPNMTWWIGQFESGLELDKKLLQKFPVWVNAVRWRPSYGWSVLLGIVCLAEFIAMSTKTVKFIYFQF